MKFNIDIKQSYLYDYLQFPRMFYVDENPENEDSMFYIALQKDPAYLEDIQSIKKLLSPYEDAFTKFYGNDELGNYDFSYLIEIAFPLVGFETLESYFDYILSHDAEIIKAELIKALLISDADSDSEKSDDLTQRAQMLCNDQNALIRVLKEVPTDEQYRWELLMNITNPQTAIRQFHEILQNIYHVFDTYYLEKKTKLEAVKSTLENALNQGYEAFGSLCNHVVPEEYLKAEGNTFLISVVSPYQMTIRSLFDKPLFIWGLKMEEGFNHLRTMREDAIEKRAHVFKLLGDKTRYNVLCLIASGESSTKNIANQLDVSSATISYHINAFLAYDLIKLSNQKKRKYELNRTALDKVWSSFLDDLS